MNPRPARIRATVLALSFALAPTSVAFAQHRGGHHGGQKAGAAAQAQARPAAKPAMPARPASKAMRSPAQATNNHPNGANHATGNPSQARATANRPRPSDASLVSSLHSTRMQLAQVDQDYGGHRSRALREIEGAMRLLGHRPGQATTATLAAAGSAASGASNRANGPTGSNRPGTTSGTGSTTVDGTNGKPIDQVASDSQLRSAQQALSNLQSQMDTSGMNPASYVQAKDAIQSAVRELNLALMDR